MIYVKYLPFHSMKNESRNMREISAALEFGFQVSVFSKDTSLNGILMIDNIDLTYDGEAYFDFSTPKWKRIFLILRNRFVVIKNTANLSADILSCHDLKTLEIAYIAIRFKKNKPQLIYDSHEFEIGRNKKRNKLQLWWVTHLERFLIKRCAFSIMVNDAIADEVQRIHKLEQRPIVVRSTPNLWTVDPAVCARRREELLAQMETPTDFMLMYHGDVMGGRGIETLLEIVKRNENVCAVILGNGEANYMESLKEQANQLDVAARVTFHPAVPIEVLWQYVGAADVGMITIPAVVKSYYYMLPNKFFENIQSEVPIICSDFPAIAPIVDKYKIGLTCDPTDLDAINMCVERMRTDKAFYAQCKENLKLAKQDLCWENEKEVLKETYKEFLGCGNQI